MAGRTALATFCTLLPPVLTHLTEHEKPDHLNVEAFSLLVILLQVFRAIMTRELTRVNQVIFFLFTANHRLHKLTTDANQVKYLLLSLEKYC